MSWVYNLLEFMARLIRIVLTSYYWRRVRSSTVDRVSSTLVQTYSLDEIECSFFRERVVFLSRRMCLMIFPAMIVIS